MTDSFDPLGTATALVKSLGYRVRVAVSPLPGGRNNQVWKVEGEGISFLLKRYFWSENDPRDRMGNEWAFLSYLRSIGCDDAPAPLAKSSAERSALLEFIDGDSVQEITTHDIESASSFFLRINEGRERASSLPLVSEGCLTLAGHLEITLARVKRLEAIIPGDSEHAAAMDFVKTIIFPLWGKVEMHVQGCPEQQLTGVLALEDRCLSPSDFGFHNALREADGRLRFLDFEYAGWDDPAKTIIDFCNQPDRILPDDLAQAFRRRVVPAFPEPASLIRRIDLLEPLYQIKWACICLNGFLPGRGFPDPRPDRSPEAHLQRARIMAVRAAESLDRMPHN